MSGDADVDQASSGEASLGERQRSRMPTARLAASIVAVVLVAFMALLWVSDPGGDQGRAIVGSPVPAVAGDGLDGSPVDLGEYTGSWVVVNFFASWCPPCREEHPELVEFSQRHGDGRAHVLGVGFDDSPAEIEAFFADKGGDWPVIPKDTGRIALDFGVRAMPESYLVAPDGTVVDVFIAGVTADELDEAIAAHGGIDSARARNVASAGAPTAPGGSTSDGDDVARDGLIPAPSDGGVVEHDDEAGP